MSSLTTPNIAQLIHHHEATIEDIRKTDLAVLEAKWADYNSLYYASHGGDVDIVEALLNKGVNIDATGRNHHTALIAATYGGNDDVVILLLQHKANPNVKDDNGWTAAHYAAMKGAPNHVLHAFASAGADFTIKGRDGKTPGDLARLSSHKATAEYVDELIRPAKSANFIA
jgi:ankyrin repeat protein